MTFTMRILNRGTGSGRGLDSSLFDTDDDDEMLKDNYIVSIVGIKHAGYLVAFAIKKSQRGWGTGRLLVVGVV